MDALYPIETMAAARRLYYELAHASVIIALPDWERLSSDRQEAFADVIESQVAHWNELEAARAAL
jgi:hypothetical protein